TALGDPAAGTTVLDPAVLDLNGQTLGAEALVLFGNGAGNGPLINSSTTAASISGTILLSNDMNFVVSAGNITLGGAVSGAAAVTKSGSGTLTLGGNNQYTGTTNV